MRYSMILALVFVSGISLQPVQVFGQTATLSLRARKHNNAGLERRDGSIWSHARIPVYSSGIQHKEYWPLVPRLPGMLSNDNLVEIVRTASRSDRHPKEDNDKQECGHTNHDEVTDRKHSDSCSGLLRCTLCC